MKRVVGIDPGRDGGLAVLRVDDVLTVERTTPIEFCDAGRKNTELDVEATLSWVAETPPDLVVIERVGYRPIDVKAAYTLSLLMRGACELVGAIKAVRLLSPDNRPDLVEVEPSVWMKKMLSYELIPLPPKPEKARGKELKAYKKMRRQAVDARRAASRAAAVSWVLSSFGEADLHRNRTDRPHDGVVDAVCLAAYGVFFTLGMAEEFGFE